MNVNEMSIEELYAAKKQIEEEQTKRYRKQTDEVENRLKNGPVFTDEELFYSARTVCPCGAGLLIPRTPACTVIGTVLIS